MNFATILRAYPLAAALIQSLDPPGELVGLHVVVRNLEAALTVATRLFTPTPEQLLALLGELRALRRRLEGITPVAYKSTGNAVRSVLTTRPAYAFWAMYDAAAYERAGRVVAAIAFLQSRGESIPNSQLIELRLGVDDPDGDRPGFSSLADAIIERANVASARSKSRLEFGFDDEAAPDAGVFATFGATTVVEAPTPAVARSLAATIGATFRRHLTNAGAQAPVGARAREIVAELLARTQWKTPCEASLLLLISMLMQQPAGVVEERLHLAVLDDDALLPADGIWRLDVTRGLLAVPVIGIQGYWKNDDWREHFPDTDAATVICVPESLLEPLRAKVKNRTVGPVFPDASAKQVRALVNEMRAIFGEPISVRRIAGMLSVPLYQASEDLLLLQRLAGHDFSTSSAGGNYYAPTHHDVAGALDRGLQALGLTDASRPLPALPEEWARRRAGARRLPSNADLTHVAQELNRQIAHAKRERSPRKRAESLTPLLAVHVAVLLLLAAGHRWTGSLCHLKRGHLCPSLGWGEFFDKPNDVLHARRLVLLPEILRESLQHWLNHCQWLTQTCWGPIAERARSALDGSAPLLFLVANGAPKPLSLRAISAHLGPLGTAVVRGGRCMLSTRLRERGVAAAPLEAQLGHTLFGQRPCHAGNLQAPGAFLAPVANETDLLMRELGFRPAVGVPDRYDVREVGVEPPAPWAKCITQIEASADRLGEIERDRFETNVSAAMRQTRRATQEAVDAVVAALPGPAAPLDQRNVRAIFDGLRKETDGSAALAVAIARTLQSVLHRVRRSGREVATLNHFEPSFPQPPWLGDQHLVALHSRNACVAWLKDPKAKGGWGTKPQRAARFALLLCVHGIVATIPDALAVIRQLPMAEIIDQMPGVLFVPVRWPGEDESRHAETVSLAGDVLAAALGLVRTPGATDIDLQELERAVVDIAHASPWHAPKSTSAETIFSGIHRVACLHAEICEPGAIAQRIRGELGSRDVPMDLMRSLLEGIAAAPPAPPEPKPRADMRRKKASGRSTDGSYLSALSHAVRSTTKALEAFVEEQDVPARRLVAEVARRLRSLAGKLVRLYAEGSQRTFLWLVARPLLAALRGVDLANVATCEHALREVWFSEAPDARRFVGIVLAAEVLEDWFVDEPLDLGDLPLQRGARRAPRALMPSQLAWDNLPVACERLLAAQTKTQDRATLGTICESVVVQRNFNLRTGETAALRAADLMLHEDVLVARVAQHPGAVVKTPAALRAVEAPLSASLELVWQRRLTLPPDGLLFPRLTSIHVGGADRNEVSRELLGDWRLCRHNDRSMAGTSAYVAATMTRTESGWALRGQPDSRLFREQSAALGHAHERSTCSSYVHTLRLHQAMRGRASLDDLSLEAIGSLVGKDAKYIKDVHRAAGGGERKGGGIL